MAYKKNEMPITFPVYFDCQATTPVDPRAVDAMLPFFTEKFGNPHASGHAFGWQAEEAVQIAREQVAALIGATEKEIIFTSGATEANNLAIKGLAHFHKREDSGKNHIVTVETEHKSILAACSDLHYEGIEVTTVPVQSNGLLDIAVLDRAIRENTLLVSVMAVNNEIGVIQNLREIGALCRSKNVCFHTDAAQAFGKIPLHVEEMQIDLLSISGHKAYAPKGIGALYVRRRPRVRLEPLISGGGQERGLRSGTVPVPLVVALGKAAEIAGQEMAEESARLLALRARFLAALKGQEFFINGDLGARIPGNLSLRFPRIPEDKMVAALRGLAVSTGSACNSGSAAPSYVIQALGVCEEEAKTTIRFGFGRFTTEAEVDYAAQLVAEAARELSPK